MAATVTVTAPISITRNNIRQSTPHEFNVWLEKTSRGWLNMYADYTDANLSNGVAQIGGWNIQSGRWSGNINPPTEFVAALRQAGLLPANCK